MTDQTSSSERNNDLNQNRDRNNSDTELRSDQDTMTRDKSEVSSELNDSQRPDDGNRDRNHDRI